MRRSASLLLAGLLAVLLSGNLPAAVKPNPSAAAAAYRQGLAHAQRGEPDQAIADFQRAIKLDPGRFEYTKALDDQLFKQAQWDAIISAWTNFIELQPTNARAYCERGGAYSHKHDLEHTLADADKACSLGDQECCAIAARFRQYFARRAAPAGAPPSPPVAPEQQGSVVAGVAVMVGLGLLTVLLCVAVVHAMRKAQAAPLPSPEVSTGRPHGVTFIAVLCLVAAVIILVSLPAELHKSSEEGPWLFVLALLFLFTGVDLWRLQKLGRGLAVILFSILLLAVVENSENWMAASESAVRFFLSLGAVCLFAWIVWYLMLSPRVALAFGQPLLPGGLEPKVQAPAPPASAASEWRLPDELHGPIPRPLQRNFGRGALLWKAAKSLALYLCALAVFGWVTRKFFDAYLFQEIAARRLDWRGVFLLLLVALALWPLVMGTRKWIFFLVGVPRLLQYGTAARAEVTAVERHRLGSKVHYRFSGRDGSVVSASLYTRGPGKDLQTGQPVAVLYDPEKPRKNTLYPADDYAVGA